MQINLFHDLIEFHEDEITAWIADVRRLNKRLNDANDPFRYRLLFHRLLEKLVIFDSIWKDTGEMFHQIINDSSSFSSKAGFPPPGEFFCPAYHDIFDSIDLINENSKSLTIDGRTNIIQKTGSSLRETVIFVQQIYVGYLVEARDLFKATASDLESKTLTFKYLRNIHFDKLLSGNKEIVDEIKRLIAGTPPPEPGKLYPYFQQLVENQYMISKIKKTAFRSLFSYSGIERCYPVISKQDGTVPLDLKKLVFKKFDDHLKQELHAKESEILQEINELKKELILLGEASTGAVKLLKILEQMKPQFPVSLPRLTELAEMDKEQVERSLKLILVRSPDIGQYDDMAQVLIFSKPDEVSTMIDNLLDQYEQFSKGNGKI